MFLPVPSQSAEYELPPAGGPYVAICTRFIDLGTQFSEHYNKTAHKVMLTWELADMADTQGRPFIISKRYTFSMHEKAQMRKDLEAWRGKPFVATDFGPGGFNTAKLLGKACQMIIAHSENGDNKYANVQTIMALGRGMTAPDPVSTPEDLSLSPDEFNRVIYDNLSDGLKRGICASPPAKVLGLTAPAGSSPGYQQAQRVTQQRNSTYQRAEVQLAPPQQQHAVANGAPRQAAHTDEMDDEIPF